MKKHFKKSEYVLAGLLALIAGFPFAVEPPAEPVEMVLGASVTSIQEKAADNYRNYRDNRRDYQKSQVLCRQLLASGKEITCPDINDTTGILIFLSTHENVPPVAAGSGMVIQSLTDLNQYQLNLMRRYQKINTCPETMRGYLPGFFELCESLLSQNPVKYRGITGPTGISNASEFTLDELIKANKGVKRTW